ncbi:hypothetical protein L873DRAFT_837034 [Choiromyces venosus 120613-1]|uniref:Uncharacterized protein n=1 Tax=Choiromyces venosus 120613-1 TaxID=1336337 RepID=A0A3N4JPK6_9PEZI|nr:hypothetical protein L873DRAFT_837034 [Choiromyces venosus 120613-1]
MMKESMKRPIRGGILVPSQIWPNQGPRKYCVMRNKIQYGEMEKKWREGKIKYFPTPSLPLAKKKKIEEEERDPTPHQHLLNVTKGSFEKKKKKKESSVFPRHIIMGEEEEEEDEKKELSYIPRRKTSVLFLKATIRLAMTDATTKRSTRP